MTDDFIDIADAIQIVLDLARSAMSADDHELFARQKMAIDTVEDFAVNQLGDD